MLREKQMAERRGRILDAAERLIRSTGGTEFSMLSVAQAAEVSPATPYNLFGSKAGLLYALLNRSLDEIAREGLAFTSDDPIERVIEAARRAVTTFTNDPTFLRPLYLVLVGVHDPVHRPRFMQRSLEYWKTALEAASRERLLPKEVDRDELARELMIHFLGVLDLWVHEELDERAFQAQIVYGSILLLTTLPGRHQAKLWRRLAAAKKKLPRKFSFEPAARAAELATTIPTIHSNSHSFDTLHASHGRSR